MYISAGHRQIGTPLKTRIEVVREDFLDFEITGGLWDDCVAWRAIIHVAPPCGNFKNEL